MADRGRDLKIGILSDVSRFDLDAPARALEDLGRTATGTGTDLDKFDRNMKDSADAAKVTARKIDTAFDAIAASSKASSRKVDVDTDKVGDSFRDVRDEANDTAREMAASFDGSSGSVIDAFQELGANAGAAFGPVGIAAGAAAAVGIGLIRDEAEKIKTLASEMVQAFADAGGKLTDEVIDAKVLQFASEDPAGFAREKQLIDDLGLSWKDYARAKAGDPAASDRITQALAGANSALTDQAAAAGSASGKMYAQQGIISELTKNVGISTAAYDLARQATNDYSSAMDGSAIAAKKATEKAATSWDTLTATYGDDIIGKIKVDSSQVLRDAQLAFLEAQSYFRRHPITLHTKFAPTGTKPIRDVP